MTSFFEAVCLPGGYSQYSGGAPCLLGREGALTLLLLRQGRCLVSPAEDDAIPLAQPPTQPYEEEEDGLLKGALEESDALEELEALDGEADVLPPAALPALPLAQPLLEDEGGIACLWGPVRVAPQGPCSLAAFAVSGAAGAALSEPAAGLRLVPPAACPGAAELFLRLFETRETTSIDEQSALAYALLCRLAGPAAGEDRTPPLVAAALAHMQEHYADFYGIEELAAALNVSKSHLIRVFSAATGTTPGRVLTAIRLDNAKRLLASPGLSLDAIAGLCGFSGSNYLCRLFKKETGETPAAWRRRMAGQPALPQTELERQLYL